MKTATTPKGALKDQARIEREAGQWVQLMQDDALTEAQWQAFEAWRDADPAHVDAFDILMEVWDGAPQLKELAALADPNPVEPWWRQASGAFLHPKWIVGGLAGAAAAAAFVALVVLPNGGLNLLNPPNAEYATQIGELRQIELPDGSVVTLGAHSEVEEHFSETERRVTLVSGEAFFEVAHNPARPFFVEAGTATVRVVGTKFDVNRRPGNVGVSVLEGEVHVSREGAVAGPDVRVLRAGEQVSVVGQDRFLAPTPIVAAVAPVLAAPAGDWRNGRLTFFDTRLADVAADINRYYGPGLEIDPAVADVRITASFRINEIEAFLGGMDVALPVSVTRSEEGRYVAGPMGGSAP